MRQVPFLGLKYLSIAVTQDTSKSSLRFLKRTTREPDTFRSLAQFSPFPLTFAELLSSYLSTTFARGDHEQTVFVFWLSPMGRVFEVVPVLHTHCLPLQNAQATSHSSSRPTAENNQIETVHNMQ